MTAPQPLTAGRVFEAGGRLAAESARFTGFGWMRGTSGNLSEVVTREPLRLAVTASGLDKGELTASDVAVVDPQGDPVAVEGVPPLVPSAEAGLHARVAALTGAGAVVHVHALNAVVAGHRWPGGVLLRDVETLKGIGRLAHDDEVVIPVIRNSQDMAELGDWFEAAYDPRTPAVIVASHGLYAWGSDLKKARHVTECVEWLLSYALAVG
ncbi:methylthioribulose 1-phosphate dehydratase [Planotetraspora mira]|jgi:methylthioribulose-1-phosphate dehydratase|uniref:Methylthioribulose-1-phosphate dehydratase n=1 Tax=Planotetraspora mira TaxID=58121 RepID=A0A8J3TJM1_9ACTN|nr:methylthioribulose 1-phosphate dehydratase [Planotetraspora mira]GII26861.1 methylthioribulose-1-phosphate dehydratase [Planotetraspora mira]